MGTTNMSRYDTVRKYADQVAAWLTGSDNRIVAVIPDDTRSGGDTVRIALLALQDAFVQTHKTARIQVLIALGTHEPMSSDAICKYLRLRSVTPGLEYINHRGKDPAALTTLHTLTRGEMLELTGGRMDLANLGAADGVPVEINKLVAEANQVFIVGPCLPHEVVGVSGGHKYFFPGCSSYATTGFTHLLSASIGLANVIGEIDTPVRRVIDFLAAKVIKPEKHLVAFVPRGDDIIEGIFCGNPLDTFREAAELTLTVNVHPVNRRYKRVIAYVSDHYQELWTAGKGSYKLQGIVEPGGELILVGRHITEVSKTWGEQIMQVGYNTWQALEPKIQGYLAKGIWPGVIAHCYHVYGSGDVRVTLATSISPDICSQLNLQYMTPAEAEKIVADADTLIVNSAGEVLYKVVS